MAQEIILSEDKKYKGYYSIITTLNGITLKSDTIFKKQDIDELQGFKVTAIYDQKNNLKFV
jgi:hypothetical protein